MPGPSNSKRKPKKKDTTAASSTTQTPPIASASEPVPSSSSPPSSAPHDTMLNPSEIAFFFQNATVPDLIRFVDAIAGSTIGRNFQLLWSRAVQHGKEEAGQAEYQRGYNAGCDAGFTEGYEDACWSMANAPSPFSDEPPIAPETSTDPIPPPQAHAPVPENMPSTVDMSTQTDSEPPSISLPPPPIDHDSIRDHAFAEGFTKGRAEGLKEGETRFDGFKTAEDLLKCGFEKGNLIGIVAERDMWITAGHSNTCAGTTPCFVTTDTSIQTDIPLPSPMPIYMSTLVQTDAPPVKLLSVEIQTDVQLTASSTHSPCLPSCSPAPAHPEDSAIQTSSKSVSTPPILTPSCTRTSWADDIPPSPPRSSFPPRDLSCLRSSTSSNPFSSLRHRSKRSDQPAPPSSSHPKLYRHPFRRRHAFRQGPRRYASRDSHAHVSPTLPSGELRWDQDPRLADLSRALVSLGWVRR